MNMQIYKHCEAGKKSAAYFANAHPRGAGKAQ
jgi:hypothetical protein